MICNTDIMQLEIEFVLRAVTSGLRTKGEKLLQQEFEIQINDGKLMSLRNASIPLIENQLVEDYGLEVVRWIGTDDFKVANPEATLYRTVIVKLVDETTAAETAMVMLAKLTVRICEALQQQPHDEDGSYTFTVKDEAGDRISLPSIILTALQAAFQNKYTVEFIGEDAVTNCVIVMSPVIS